MPEVSINNKKARFEYEILETFTAGMKLEGSEIKSIRQGKASIKEAYCFIENDEVFVRNMSISIYEEAGINNHEPYRIRKLLLNSAEIKKLDRKLRDVGLTIIPLKVFINKNGWAKMEIALAKGKKIYDKREDIRKKDVKRQIERDQKA
ncbi:MAG: SsrA-binding protein SmpB [Vicingaceae bacterium]